MTPLRSRSRLRTILSLGRAGGVSEEEKSAFAAAIESQGGWLFRVEIEGVWASFPGHFEALMATSEILHRHPYARAGLHLGDVTFTEDGDLLGHTLSVAKRLEVKCPEGSAFLSQALVDRIDQPCYFAAFSDTFAAELKGLGEYQAVQLTPTILERERPFKFLDSYSEDDTELFFGREKEVADCRAALEKSRRLVLYGTSGVGKSSLLGAGLYPLYQDDGYETHTIRCLSDPLRLLSEKLELPKGELAECLVDYLHQNGVEGLLFCFDQFEEFFLRVPFQERAAFWSTLGEMMDDVRLGNVRWVFSLREDFLAELGEAEDDIPGLLDCHYRLTPLTSRQAELCIIGPAQRCGRWVETELVEAIVTDLFHEGVNPPELQIVLDRLDQTRDKKTSWLTLDSYRRLGGFQEILVDYLYEVIERSKDSKLSREILLLMMTEQGTKQAISRAQIQKELDLDKPLVDILISELIEARLVRSLSDSELIEMSHEYLIEEIQSWADEAELAFRYANLALESEVDSWQRMGSLMDEGRLQFLVGQSERLRPDRVERTLLLRASVIYGFSPKVWLGGEKDEELLLALLDELSDNGVAQRRLIAELFPYNLGEEAFERVRQATLRWGNPTLLKQLGSTRDKRREALRAAVSERFLGSERMAKIAAGPFVFGSDENNKLRRKAGLHRYLHNKIESEQNLTVCELEDFWMDLCPVTNAEYAEFMPSHFERFPDHEADHPVVSLTLFEAESYAGWLGKELPSEQEWEKAARGPDGLLYPWGNDYHARHLNSGEDSFKQTTPVRAFPSGRSVYGCWDMAGNVWEWTTSRWSESGPFIVQKGGSTVCSWPQLQCSSRMDAFPDFVLRWTGFRLKSDSPGYGVGDL